MQRAHYLNAPEVVEFIHWLWPKLDKEGSFIHQYIDRRSSRLWRCVSIFDAFTQYRWNFSFRDRDGWQYTGSTFAESANALASLRNQLRIALQLGDVSLLSDASRMVFEWGGVRKGNIPWAAAQGANLVATYRAGKDVLNPESADDSLPFASRFNSGMTKIYSLLVDDFIIYDSRVGAALGLFVVSYCQAQGLSTIPPSLRFPWTAAQRNEHLGPQEQKPKYRKFAHRANQTGRRPCALESSCELVALRTRREIATVFRAG